MPSLPTPEKQVITLGEEYLDRDGQPAYGDEARALAEHALKARLKALLDDFDNVHPDFLHDVSTTVLDELLSDARKGWQLPDGDFFAELLADCPPVENPLFQRETLQEQVVELPPRDGDQFEHTCQLVLTRKGEITPEHVENIARTYVEAALDSWNNLEAEC